MSRRTDQDNDGLLKKNKKLADDSDDDGDFAEPKKQNAESVQLPQQVEDDNLKVPSIANLSICQWVVVAILYLVLAFLVGFIIYISSTWTKDRTNEYT